MGPIVTYRDAAGVLLALSAPASGIPAVRGESGRALEIPRTGPSTRQDHSGPGGSSTAPRGPPAITDGPSLRGPANTVSAPVALDGPWSSSARSRAGSELLSRRGAGCLGDRTSRSREYHRENARPADLTAGPGDLRSGGQLKVRDP